MITFDNDKMISGGICASKGFSAGGINGFIKPNSKKNDIGMISCVKKCNTVALYTTNKVKGAPIIVTKKHLQDNLAQAVIVNSGNANTCNPNGIEIADGMCELTAKALGISADDVVVASTGVIGQPMTMEPFEKYIPALAKDLSDFGGDAALEAIMTTDTRKKQFAIEFELDGKTCHIGGMSKGSGMINPNMATMLAFITTDANISVKMMDKALREMNAVTYNMVCVDGDTSTNDMVTLMSSALAGNKEITEENSDYEIFANALYTVMVNLAIETARDGEGATKLIECIVNNAKDEKTAKSIAKFVISSSLFKAAMFAADANWGRILCAIGYAEGDFDVSQVTVEFLSRAGRVKVCEHGAGVIFSEEEAHKILSEDEITVIIKMSDEENEVGSAVAWGCDLTYDYVKINAEYRS